MLLVGTLTSYPLTDSKRVREIDQWSVFRYPAPNNNVYVLYGRVVHEANGDVPTAHLTKTSAIVSCEGNVVTTESGSKYILKAADEDWAYESEFELGNPDWIPEKYWLK